MDEDTIAVMKERKLQILTQKNEERKVKLEKMKEKMKPKDTLEEESMNNIMKKFEEVEEDIVLCLKQIEDVNVPQESLPELFDSCYTKLEELQNVITLSSHVLKIYHKRRCQERYRELNEKRLKLEQTLIPAKKFSFKRAQTRKTNSETGDTKDFPTPNTDVVDAKAEKPARKFALNMDDEFGFSNKENERLSFAHEQVLQKDVIFRDLKQCQVEMKGGANTAHFVALTNCRILCGPVCTSLFVENCSNCVFVIACQQLRVHNTSDVDFYLHVTSRAIIENCSRVRFAPYNWKYENIEKHFDLCTLSMSTNNWNLINDFDWLSSAPSPNWSVIEESERITQWG